MVPRKNIATLRILLIRQLFFAALLFTTSTGFGQFYNGLKMEFGKNRVQYSDFFWNYYRFSDYDIYFYADGYELAELTADILKEKIPEVEQFLGHELNQRIIFLVFNRHTDFLQHNIGLITGSEEENIGGKTEVIKNKVFAYFSGDREKYRREISKSIARVVFNNQLYGGKVQERIANSTLISMPEWFTKGLFSYIAQPWDIRVENKLRDGILSGKYKKFNHLTGTDAEIAGHSFWYYIARNNGPSVIQNIIYMTRINKSVEAGLLYVLGKSTEEIFDEWYNYYRDKYCEEVQDRQPTEGENVISWLRKKRKHQRIKLSPNNRHIAYISHQKGKHKIWLYNIETDRRKRIYTSGNKLDQITDYSYPVMAWHPSGEQLAFFTERRGRLHFFQYFLEDEELRRRSELRFEKVLSFDYASNGLDVVLSAVRKGQTDLYLFNVPANSSEPITNDPADDLDPEFINNSRQILFSSNRRGDTLRTNQSVTQKQSPTFDLYIYNYKTGNKDVLSNVTQTPYSNEYEPIGLRKNIYAYLSDENGIMNKHIAKYDSTISYIDTTTHYRYYTSHYPLSNYDKNIVDFSVATQSLHEAELFYSHGKYHLYHSKLSTRRSAMEGDFRPTSFFNWRKKRIQKQDSLREQKQKPQKPVVAMEQLQDIDTAQIPKPPEAINPDSMKVNINDYLFEQEKYPLHFMTREAEKQKSKKKQEKKKKNRMPRVRIYQTTFYKDFLVNQVDFGFMNNSYQAFTGSQVYFNPGLTGFFKIGSKDLFADYRLVGGVRFSGDFNSNEYILNVENLKDRLDKQLIFHRQVINQGTQIGLQKTRTNNLLFRLNYPLDQVNSIRGTLNLRYDKSTILAETMPSLETGNTYSSWSGQKLEYVFDNTRERGLNLREGMRFKIFGEAYQEIDGNFNDLYVVGADFRVYKQLHRDLTFAGRVAGSTSLGSKRLVYYLGSVDNWINISSNVPTFDRSIPISQRDKYAFQSLATNMRGFSQNVRNGNSFALVNAELRWPVFRYFFNRPLSSDFFHNFQLVGFADAGSAWVGLTPYSDKNKFHSRTLERGPITMTIDANRSAFVAGTGFGVRSTLFGYFIRADWAWGIADYEVYPGIFYLSLSLDF